MDIDLDLYRHEVRVSTNPLVRFSAIDISPDQPPRYDLHVWIWQANLSGIFAMWNPNVSCK